MAQPALRPWFHRTAPADRRTMLSPTCRSLFKATVVVVVSLASLVVGVMPAVAAPSVEEVERQIDEAWNKLEPAIEKHNATRQDLIAKKKQVAELTKKIQPLQLQIDLAMSRVSAFAVRQYKGGSASAFNAIISTGSPTTLIEELTVLDQFARRQQADIKAVVDLKERYAAKKAPLDTLVAQLTKAEAEQAAKAKQIDAEVDRLQKLRTQLYGSTVSLGSLRPAPCPSTYQPGGGGTAAKYACAQIGKPYVWGADGPDSFDCSGLMLAAWAKAGVYLPHNAARQRQVTDYVSRADLRIGDLVFYYSDLHHVGMYVGNGWVVHASQSGVPVKMKRVDDGQINSFGRPG